MRQLLYIVFCLFALLLSVEPILAQQEAAENLELPRLDKSGNLQWLIRAKRIESRFDIKFKNDDTLYTGYYVEKIKVFIPQKIESEKRVLLIVADFAYYVNSIRRLEVWQNVSLYLLPRVFNIANLRKIAANFHHYEFVLKTERVTVVWKEKSSTEKNVTADNPKKKGSKLSKHSTKKQLFAEVTGQTRISFSYPQKGIAFTGSGFQAREGEPIIKIFKNVVGKYEGISGFQMSRVGTNKTSSIELKALHGAEIRFRDLNNYDISKITLSGAVRMLSLPSNAQLACSKLVVKFQRINNKPTISEICASGNIKFFTPSVFETTCNKLNFFFEIHKEYEKFWGTFTGVKAVKIFSEAGLGFGSYFKNSSENQSAYFLCDADKKISFERKILKETADSECGYESWQLVKNARIERIIKEYKIPNELSLSPRNKGLSNLPTRTYQRETFTRTDLVMQGKEEIALFFALSRESEYVFGEAANITRSLRKLNVRNTGSQSIIEIAPTKLDNIRIAANNFLYVRKNKQEAQITIQADEPQIIFRTAKNFLSSAKEHSNAKLRYLFTSKQTIFLLLRFDSAGAALTSVILDTAGPVSLSKSPYQIAGKTNVGYYARFESGELRLILHTSKQKAFELTYLEAKSFQENAVILETNSDFIQANYIRFEKLINPKDQTFEVPERYLPRWKAYYTPVKISFVLKGKILVKSTNMKINRAFALSDSKGKKVIPELISIKCSKALSYSSIFLEAADRKINCGQILRTSGAIELRAFSKGSLLFSLNSKDANFTTSRDWHTGLSVLKTFSCHGASLANKAELNYALQGFRVKALHITLSHQNAGKISLTGAPKAIIDLQKSRFKARNKKISNADLDFKITLSFPPNKDVAKLLSQKIEATGFIKNIKISPRSLVEIQSQKTPSRKLRLKADTLEIFFKHDAKPTNKIRLVFDKLVAKGNVIIADSVRTVNGDKLVLKNENGFDLLLTGKNSVLKEEKNGKIVFLLSGIYKYAFSETNPSNPSHKNSITLKAKKGIKLRLRR